MTELLRKLMSRRDGQVALFAVSFALYVFSNTSASNFAFELLLVLLRVTGFIFAYTILLEWLKSWELGLADHPVLGWLAKLLLCLAVTVGLAEYNRRVAAVHSGGLLDRALFGFGMIGVVLTVMCLVYVTTTVFYSWKFAREERLKQS